MLGYSMLLFTGIGDFPLSSEQTKAGLILALGSICFIYMANIAVMVYLTLRKVRLTLYKKQKCRCLFRLCPLRKDAGQKSLADKQYKKKKKIRRVKKKKKKKRKVQKSATQY